MTLRELATRPDVTAIAYDSRQVKPGSVFVALRGVNADGTRFVPQAIANGYQGALMAPTEVLAEQHHISVRSFVGDLTVGDSGTLLGDRPLRVDGNSSSCRRTAPARYGSALVSSFNNAANGRGSASPRSVSSPTGKTRLSQR